VRDRVLGWLLSRSRLPEVPVAAVDEAIGRRYEEFTARHIDGATAVGTPVPPGPLLGYLQWLATHRRVLFHGTRRDGLAELSTARRTRDASAFGDQTAVFASDDPVWAMFFAVLVRGGAVTSMRNGAVSTRRDPLRRRYWMSVNHEVPPGAEKASGFLYVLPATGFVSEATRLGLYTSHWVSHVPVRPLARFAVAPEDFPLPIGRHHRDESTLRTVWRART
jgi:hypothetical protein